MKHLKKHLILEESENIDSPEKLMNDIIEEISITEKLIRKRIRTVLGISGMDCIYAMDQVIQLYNQVKTEVETRDDKIEEFYKRIGPFENLEDKNIYDDIEIKLLDLRQKREDFNDVKEIFKETKDVYISKYSGGLPSRVENVLKKYDEELLKNL